MARDGSVVSDLIKRHAQERHTLAGGNQPRLRPTDFPPYTDIPEASTHPAMDDDEMREQGKDLLAREILKRKGVEDGPEAYKDGPTMKSKRRTILESGKATKDSLKWWEEEMEENSVRAVDETRHGFVGRDNSRI